MFSYLINNEVNKSKSDRFSIAIYKFGSRVIDTKKLSFVILFIGTLLVISYLNSSVPKNLENKKNLFLTFMRAEPAGRLVNPTTLIRRGPIDIIVQPARARFSDVTRLRHRTRQINLRDHRIRITILPAAYQVLHLRLREINPVLHHEIHGRSDAQIILQEPEVFQNERIFRHRQLLVQSDLDMGKNRYRAAQPPEEEHHHDHPHDFVHDERHVNVLEELVQSALLGLLRRVFLGTADEAAHVETVIVLTNRVQRQQTHETSNLQDKINQQSHAGVQRERLNGRHVRQPA